MEDTTKTEEQKQADVMIEEMQRDAESVPPVGDETKVGTVVHRGDAETPTPIIVSSIEGGDKVYIYDTKTGERSRANKNQLRQILRWQHPDGTYKFTTRKMESKVKAGILKCLLHADNPKREHYDELGLPTCRKSNITAPYMVEQHMKKRHPSAWATIEKERTDAERKEDREFQHAVLSAVTPEKPPLYVSDKDKKK